MTHKINHNYTDKRLITSALKKAARRAHAAQNTYWRGLLSLRADPGVRAVKIVYDEASKKPGYRIFNYDEMIALGCLLVLGYPKRHAAAMVAQGFASAKPAGASFQLVGTLTYSYFTLKLNDQSLWEVACPVEVPFEDLEYVGDYAVWLEHQGKKIDPADTAFPKGLIDVIGTGNLLPGTSPVSGMTH